RVEVRGQALACEAFVCGRRTLAGDLPVARQARGFVEYKACDGYGSRADVAGSDEEWGGVRALCFGGFRDLQGQRCAVQWDSVDVGSVGSEFVADALFDCAVDAEEDGGEGCGYGERGEGGQQALPAITERAEGEANEKGQGFHRRGSGACATA